MFYIVHRWLWKYLGIIKVFWTRNEHETPLYFLLNSITQVSTWLQSHVMISDDAAELFLY